MATKTKPTLIVVESPAKAKTISKYLGDDFIVKASKGHIMDLTVGGKYPLGVDIDGGFIPKYGINSDKKGLVQELVDAAGKSGKILLASDPDREGEAIAWHLKFCLESSGKDIKRVEFHEISKTKVQNGIKNPRELDKNLYDAQQARRVLDRIVGFKVSPFVTRTLAKEKLSAGRVQSVAVRLVVDREREIENFKPEEYWNIAAALAKKSKKEDTLVAKYIKKITNKTDADKIKSDLDASIFIVTDVEAKPKLRNPYPPFTTSRLLQAAAGKHGFAAVRTSKAAQSLYENGYITYIRTDSVRTSPESVDALRDWLKGEKYDIPDKQNFYKNKDSAQDAHEAIRPTSVSSLPAQLSIPDDDQKKIYKLVWERFVASQMKPAIYDTVAVSIKASKGDHELRANGSTLRYKGWLAIAEDFDESKKDEDENNIKLPELKTKDELELIDPRVSAEQKFTTPPSRFSEQSLIKELEKRGIGRPATYPTIMSKITDRDYVERKKNTFFASDLGKQIVDLLVKKFPFMQYEYTADMEAQLDRIAEGKFTYLEMMNGFYDMFKKDLESAYDDAKKPTDIMCDKCGLPMIVRHSKSGAFLGCSGYSKEKGKSTCSNTKSCTVDGDKITIVDKKDTKHDLIDGVECPKCKGGMILRKGKFGDFYGCASYPKCDGLSKIPYGKDCPDCGKPLTAMNFSGNEKLGCTGYPACKHIEDMPGVAPKKFYKSFTKGTKK